MRASELCRMPTFNDFLAEIRARPDDDEPRLVCADWLEERGDPRGDFIRRQIELERFPDASRDSSPRRRRRLVHGVQQAVVKHLATWDVELKNRVFDWEYRRGFIEHVTLRAVIWIDDGPRLRELAPLRSIELTEVHRRVAQITECSTLSGLRRIAFAKQGLLADAVRQFCDSPFLDDLEELSFWGNPIGDEGVAVLAARPFPRLRMLELSHGRLTDAGLRPLADAAWLGQLAKLDLRRNFLTRGAVAELQAAPRWNPATRVEMGGNEPLLSEDWLDRFVQQLRDFPNGQLPP